MNNDVYNNKKGSSLEEAYAKLREAQEIRKASVNQQQFDMANGVALNTTPLAVNRQQVVNEPLVVPQESQDTSDANWFVRTVGTADQALRNVAQGFLKLGEGVVDSVLGIGGIFDSEWAENVIKYDATKAIMDWQADNFSINALYKNQTGRNLADESWLYDSSEKVQNIVQGVEQGIGNALGFIALNAIPVPGLGIALSWAGSSGMAMEEQFNDAAYNGNYYGSWGSAFLKGGVETGLEYAMGWSPKKMGVSTKTFGNVLKGLAKDFAEEGLEEVASDVITPFFSGMYTDKTIKESYEDTTFESLAETFLVGGITGAIMSGAGEVYSTVYLSPEGQKIAHEIKENEEWYKQAYDNFKNNPNEQQALVEFNKVRDQVAQNLQALGERTSKLAEKYQDRLGNVVTIDGEQIKLSDALNKKSETTKIADARAMAVKETIDMINSSNVKSLDNLKVEFVTEGTEAYQKAFKTNEKGINGAIVGNKLYLNTNSQKAFKFVLGHELTHPMESNSAYKSVYKEILDSLTDNGKYEELYKKTEKLYAEQIKNKTKEQAKQYIEQELVADYIGENFKNFAEIQKLFTKQSTWEKFKDLVKSVRKSNRSSKAKEYYQRFLKESYNTQVQEKKQLQKAVAYSKSGKVFKFPEWYKEKLKKGTRLKDSEFVTLDIKKLIEDNSLMTGSTTSLRSDVWGEKESDYTFDENKIQDWWYAPIIVDNKDGKYKIQDGRHRVIALYNAGYSKIEVVMYEPRIKYSKGENLMKQPKQKLVAQLKDGKVYDIVEGEEVIKILDSLEKGDSGNVVLKENREKVLDKINELLNVNNVNTKEFEDKLDKLAQELAESVRISVETDKINPDTNKKVRKYITPSEYLGLSKDEVTSYLKARIIEEINRIAVTSGRKSLVTLLNEKQQATENKLDKLRESYGLFVSDLKQTISNLKKEIKLLENHSVDTRKAILKVQNLKTWAKTAVDQKAEYAKNNLKGLAVPVAKTMKNIQYTDKKSVNSSYVNVIGTFNEFYNSEITDKDGNKQLVKNAYANKDANVQALFEEALKYFTDKIDAEIKNASDPDNVKYKSLEIDKPINDDNYPLVSEYTEVELFAKLISEVRRMVNASSKITYAELDGKQVIAKDVAKEELEYQIETERKTPNKVFEGANSYILSLVDVHTYMKIMAHGKNNSLMEKIYQRLFEAQNYTYKVSNDLFKDIRDYFEKDGKKLKKQLESKKLTVEFGGTQLTLDEAIGLYLMMDTDNAYTHLVGDGVELETLELQKVRRIAGEKFKEFLSKEAQNEIDLIQGIINTNTKTTQLSQDQLEYLQRKFNTDKKSKADLRGRITELQKDAIQDARKQLKEQIGSEFDEYISKLEAMYENSGKYYVEATEKIFGFSFGRKKKYYPTKSVKTELSNIDALTSYVSGTLNPSFTKKVTGGTNALYVGGSLSVAQSFVNTLSTYCGVTVEIKNLNKFLNAEIKTKEGKYTVTDYLTKHVDSKFNKRIEVLFKTMQGIKTKETTDVDKIIKKIRSAAAKSALGANLKTIVTQFTAYPRAYLYLKGTNLLKALKTKGARTRDGLKGFDWAMKESAYINNRYENGNVYNIQSVGAFATVDKFTDFLMKPIEWADKKTLERIWYACQYECMENGKIDYDKALKLFEKVNAETQAQYDALGNGSVTRIDNELAKSFLMYSSETRKLFSRIVESIYMVAVTEKGSAERKEAVNFLAKTSASTIASAVMVTMIATLLKKLKGDYDDKEKEEILKEILLDEFAMNFVGMFPVIKDIYSALISGYDIQISGFAQVTDMVKVFSTYLPKLMDLDTSEDERRAVLIQTITKICHFFGIPARNIINDILYPAGFIDIHFDTDMVLKLKNFFYNTTSANLNTYMKTYNARGQTDKVASVIQIKFDNYVAGKIDEKSAQEIARLYSKGVISSLPSQIGEEVTYNGETITLKKAQKSHAKQVYSLANDILPTMLKSSIYANLSDEEKAYAIKKLYSTYYDLAKGSMFADYDYTRLSQVANYVDVGKFSAALAKINSITETKTATKKVMVQRYINSLSMKANEKYLLLYLAGYNLDDSKKAMAISYLRQNGMLYRDAKNYFA